jgi:hypothetical protein
LLAGGMAQREIARHLRINRKTVARYLKRLGYAARQKNLEALQTISGISAVVFDDMEGFEHTKCKPLSITVAVVENTRQIICAEVTQMPAKGLLARIARKKYGPRDDHRKYGLARMARQIKKTNLAISKLKSDRCPRYPASINKEFPDVQHETFLSRRACVVGQGELKKGGNDPLFYLNHNCAMIRDRIKRLSRRTWCTTKDPRRLQNLLDIFIQSHNQRLAKLRPSKGWNHTV